MIAIEPLLAMSARDLITRDLVVIGEDQSLQEAAQLLSQNNVTGAPVVNGNGRCVGVISATDLLRWVRKDDTQVVVAFDPFYRIEQSARYPAEPVRRFMTTNLVTVKPDQVITTISRKMLDAHVHRVIVVDDELRPQGVVSSIDILAAVARQEHVSGTSR